MQVPLNVAHHCCWLLAIARWVSDVVLTRVPDVAQADNNAHRRTAAGKPRLIRIMIGSFGVNGIGYSDLWINAGDRSILHDLPSFPIGA